MTMLRMPKGLWADLEETIIQQDRQFLTEVARALGLPVADVIKRCIGTGASQAILIGEDDTSACPWWTRSKEGLWQPCGRLRLTETSPCQIHTHSEPSHVCCLGSDDRLSSVEEATPFRWRGEIYWCTETATYREDGTCVDLTFKRIEHQGSPLFVKITNSG